MHSRLHNHSVAKIQLGQSRISLNFKEIQEKNGKWDPDMHTLLKREVLICGSVY